MSQILLTASAAASKSMGMLVAFKKTLPLMVNWKRRSFTLYGTPSPVKDCMFEIIVPNSSAKNRITPPCPAIEYENSPHTSFCTKVTVSTTSVSMIIISASGTINHADEKLF